MFMMKAKVNPVKALTPEQDLQSFRKVGAVPFAELRNPNLLCKRIKKAVAAAPDSGAAAAVFIGSGGISFMEELFYRICAVDKLYLTIHVVGNPGECFVIFRGFDDCFVA